MPQYKHMMGIQLYLVCRVNERHFVGQWYSVINPAEVLGDAHAQKFGAADPLHNSTVDGQRGVLSVGFKAVDHNLLCFPYIWRKSRGAKIIIFH